MNKILVGVAAAAAITVGAGTAHAEQCLWIGHWQCDNSPAAASIAAPMPPASLPPGPAPANTYPEGYPGPRFYGPPSGYYHPEPY